MSAVSASITLCTVWPLMSMPRMSAARACASSGPAANLTPPALPRPPTFTCALTTTRPPSRSAIARASCAVVATPPPSTGSPCRANSSRPWYSYRSTGILFAVGSRPQPSDTLQEAVWRTRKSCRAPSLCHGGPDVRPYPVHNGLSGGAGREDLRHAEPLQLGDVGVGDDAPAEDDDVARLPLAQQLDDPAEERHVSAGEHRQADRVGVLLQGGLHDLLGRLVQPGVDDLHAGI